MVKQTATPLPTLQALGGVEVGSQPSLQHRAPGRGHDRPITIFTHRCFGDVVVVERMFPQGSYDFLLSGILSINVL